jgi:diguanylate cyclase
MKLRHAYAGYQAANLRPMIPLSLLATVTVYITAVEADAWTLPPVLRFAPALPLLLLALLAGRTKGPVSLSVVALCAVLFTEVTINFAGIGLTEGLTWAMPGSLLLPVVTSVFWPARWSFLTAMALTAFGPLPMLLMQGSELQQLQFAVYMSVAVTLSAMMHAVMERTSRRQLQLELQLREQATFDGLTGVLLRNCFLDAAQRVLEEHHAQRTPVCVAYLDADRFKRINDHYGHSAGDAVLIGLADVLRAHVRAHDLIGRVGGEEFAILLPDIDLAAAQYRMETVRRAVRLMVQRPDGPMTISIGIAQSRGPGETIDALLVRADQAMRQAKETGRDRAVLDTTLS